MMVWITQFVNVLLLQRCDNRFGLGVENLRVDAMNNACFVPPPPLVIICFGIINVERNETAVPHGAQELPRHHALRYHRQLYNGTA